LAKNIIAYGTLTAIIAPGNVNVVIVTYNVSSQNYFSFQFPLTDMEPIITPYAVDDYSQPSLVITASTLQPAVLFH